MDAIDEFIQKEYIRQLRIDLLSMLDSVFCEPYFLQDRYIINRNLLYLYKFNMNHKCILALHYGLFDEPMTYKEISNEVGYCETVISEHEKDAIWKIRNSTKGIEFMKNYAFEQYESIIQKKKDYTDPLLAVQNMESIKELISQLDNL